MIRRRRVRRRTRRLRRRGSRGAPWLVPGCRMHARSVSRPPNTVPVRKARPRACTASGSARLSSSSAAGARPAGRARKATIEVSGAAASSSQGSRLDERRQLAGERVRARHLGGDPGAAERGDRRPRLQRAERSRLLGSVLGERPDPGVGVLPQVRRDEAERVAQVVAAPHQRAAGVDGDAEPLMGVEHQRVGPFHAAVPGRDRRVEHPERAVGAVDVEPEALLGRHPGERVERVDHAGVDGAGRADEQRRQGAARAIGGDRGAQRGRVEPAAGERHLAHRAAPEAEELEGASHAAVRLGRHVGDELRGAGEAIAADVMAGRRERAAAGAREADDRRGGPAAGEQAGARRVREAHELGQPAHHRALEVDVGVIAGDDARVHRGCCQRGHHAGGGGRRIDPAEEGRMAVAHRVREDVAQRRRGEVVQRDRLLREGQVEQLLAQRIGERLPDRRRGQRGEMIDDTVDERVRRAAERRQLILARLAHDVRIWSPVHGVPGGRRGAPRARQVPGPRGLGQPSGRLRLALPSPVAGGSSGRSTRGDGHGRC